MDRTSDSKQPHIRSGIVAGLVLLALIRSAAAADQQAAAVPTIDVQFQTGQLYLVGKWAPIRIRCTNPANQLLAGFVQILAGRDNGVVIRQPVNVPARSELTVQSVVFAGISKNENVSAGEIARAVWLDAGGKEVARSSLNGIRAGTSQAAGGSSPASDFLLAIGQPTVSQPTVSQPTASQPTVSQHAAVSPPHEAVSLESQISAALDKPLARAEINDVENMPRIAAGYDGCTYVYLTNPPDEMDAAQRRALLEHIRQGASLIVPANSPAAMLDASWLAEYLPVRIIGFRQATSIIEMPHGGTDRLLHLEADATVAEALAADVNDHVAWHDDTFVHAAVRTLGLGRVIVTSFSPEGVEANDPQLTSMWHDLLLWRSADVATAEPTLPMTSQRSSIMTHLLGRSAPSWPVAATVAGGYAVVALMTQVLLRGTRRPLAFGVSVVAAVVITATLIASKALRADSDVLSGAQFSTVTLGFDGTGQVRQQFAFYGESKSAELSAAMDRVECHPVDFDPNSAPIQQPSPFFTADVGIRGDSVGRIWEATSASTAVDLQLHGTFGSDGLMINADNQLPAPIINPLLSYGAAVFRLPSLPRGHSQSVIGFNELNPIGVYDAGSGLADANAALRTEMARQLLDPRSAAKAVATTDPTMDVMGWLDESVPPLLQLKTSTPLRMRGETLIRAPLTIDPSPPNANVHLDAPFNRLVRYRNTASPIDVTGSAQGNIGQSWVMAVTPPAALGKFKPQHATVSVDLDAPQYEVVLQAQQFAHPITTPKFRENDQATALATWDHGVGHRTVSFDVEPQDLSPDGSLVLRVAVQSVGGGSADVSGPRWGIRQLGVTLDGNVAPVPTPTPDH